MSIDSTMTALADSIRAKSGATGALSLAAMKTAVDSIPAAFEPVVITDASYLFSGQIPESAYAAFRIVNPTYMNHMYYLNDAILNIDMTKLNLTPSPYAITLNNMFYNCDQLQTVKMYPGLRARSMMSIFQGCSSLTAFDMTGVNIGDCVDYRSFINGCKALTEFDGAIFPNLSVANNNCQNFFCNTLGMRKVWIPKEWNCPNTTAGYSLFVSNGGSNKMNANLQIFTDATSEADQISAGRWSALTMTYNSSGTKIPAAQIHYGATHAEYEAY